ncbi:hypothetical protein [Propionibacterium sp.]|uniref:hypothetical protein n=1 Tax=Propionibacterium sp. TaxID=1977903 RepID=UPI0039ED0543
MISEDNQRNFSFFSKGGWNPKRAKFEILLAFLDFVHDVHIAAISGLVRVSSEDVRSAESGSITGGPRLRHNDLTGAFGH